MPFYDNYYDYINEHLTSSVSIPISYSGIVNITTNARVDKVIFNPPATIVYVNGKKYVSKVHDEEFDEEKGVLMCLAKAQGITHSELKRLIKNAKRSK